MTNQIVFKFVASDGSGGSLVEAVDDFEIEGCSARWTPGISSAAELPSGRREIRHR
jgi:hypothetical protein